jgi:deoxycytidine triphosphate deaminase
MNHDPFLNLDFPANNADAASRFASFEDRDPLPEVPPALLNAGDIYDYARITGMIYPFETDKTRLKQKLKSASYEIDFLGDVYYFSEEDGKHHQVKIEPNIPFELPKNSIAFVFLETKFRLPDYIALRFNLRIKHVHRGLLLGTGPLVDPGFVGRLLIPLHNLTSESYTLIGGEGFIWVEFTKLSPHKRWDSRGRSFASDYMIFPRAKRDLTAQQYFNAASNGKPAISSIPGEVNYIKRRLKQLTWGGVISAIVLLVGLLLPTWALVNDSFKNMVDSGNALSNLQTSLNDLKREIDLLQKEITALKQIRKLTKP